MSAKDITIDVNNLQLDMRTLKEDFAKFKGWWIEEFTKISHYMKVEIGVRNNKIKELNGKIDRLENLETQLQEEVDRNRNDITYLEGWQIEAKIKIETLEQTLEELR